MSQPDLQAVEAARYALLRRLAPSMRHHLVVHLQPIGMVCEILDRRIKAPEPRLGDVHESAQKINGLARGALKSTQEVVSWLAPEEGATCGVGEGVAECLLLVGTSFSFRGFALRNEVGEPAGAVARPAIRNMLTGALVHLADSHAGPADIGLTAEPAATGIDLVLAIRAASGEQGFNTSLAYRALRWEDVEALAAGEGARATRDGPGVVRLSFAWCGGAPGA